MLGRVRGFLEGGDDFAAGHCRLEEDLAVVPDSEIFVELFQDHDQDFWTLVGVTPLLGPGSHSFGIACNQTGGTIDYSDASVTAVALSPG